jgi:cytochrome c
LLQAQPQTISYRHRLCNQQKMSVHMDSFEFNKIAGAVLATALTVFGLQEVSGAIFQTHHGEKPGFFIEVAEASEAAAAAIPAGEIKSVGTLLASADPVKGAAGAKACQACHDFTKGGPKKTGPNLWDIVDRGIGTKEDFKYSAGFAALAGKTWTYDELNAFLTAPKAHVKGTTMSFGGIKNDEKRADVLAFLASLSDAPKPFPAP